MRRSQRIASSQTTSAPAASEPALAEPANKRPSSGSKPAEPVAKKQKDSKDSKANSSTVDATSTMAEVPTASEPSDINVSSHSTFPSLIKLRSDPEARDRIDAGIKSIYLAEWKEQYPKGPSPPRAIYCLHNRTACVIGTITDAQHKSTYNSDDRYTAGEEGYEDNGPSYHSSVGLLGCLSGTGWPSWRTVKELEFANGGYGAYYYCGDWRCGSCAGPPFQEEEIGHSLGSDVYQRGVSALSEGVEIPLEIEWRECPETTDGLDMKKSVLMASAAGRVPDLPRGDCIMKRMGFVRGEKPGIDADVDL